MKFVIKRAKRGRLRRAQWRWVLVGDNGATLATSETYNNRVDAIAICELIRIRAREANLIVEKE